MYCVTLFFFCFCFFTTTTQLIMPKQLGRQNLTLEEHRLMVSLADSTYPCDVIAEQFNCLVRTVYQIFQNYKTRNTFENLFRSSRPFKVNNRALYHLDRHINTSKCQILDKNTYFLNTSLSFSVCKNTVFRTLNHCLGYHSYYACKKPFLTVFYIEKQLI